MLCPRRGLCGRLGELRCLLRSQDCPNGFSRRTASLLRGFCCTKCPQHHPCRVAAPWHGFTRQIQNQVLPPKKIKPHSQGPPALPGSRGFGSGRAGRWRERGLFLMPGRKRRASLSRWAPGAPCPLRPRPSPQPPRKPRSLRLAGSFPGKASVGGNDLLRPEQTCAARFQGSLCALLCPR